MPAVRDSFARVCEGADIVIAEGAGSPAEINLRTDDIANMGFARAEGVPVVLVGGHRAWRGDRQPRRDGGGSGA